jgi:hypothetical protein
MKGDFVSPSAQALAERERRRAAINRQSAIDALLGLPPPGYSALDVQRAQAQATAAAEQLPRVSAQLDVQRYYFSHRSFQGSSGSSGQDDLARLRREKS